MKQTPARACRGKRQDDGGTPGKPAKNAAPPAVTEAELYNTLRAANPELLPSRRPRPPGPDTCHQFVRRLLARALPELYLTLLKRAHKGDLAAMKLLWQLAELDRQTEASGEGKKDRQFVQGALAKFRKR